MPVRPTLSSDRLRGKAGPSATTESGRPARPPIEPASQSPAAKLPPAASPAADPDSSEQPPRSGAATGTSPTDSSTIGVTDVRRVWPEVLAAVQRRRRATQILLESATVVGVESGVLQVAMPSAGMARRVMETANADLLRAALREILGVDWTIRCQAVGGSPPAAGPPRGATGGPPSASPARGGRVVRPPNQFRRRTLLDERKLRFQAVVAANDRRSSVSGRSETVRRIHVPEGCGSHRLRRFARSPGNWRAIDHGQAIR